ncbi:MAG: hypothetical protein QOC80_1411 [Frankiaceae bacterium]|nr:hypothetical protein [Frankiaceae bacterium]
MTTSLQMPNKAPASARTPSGAWSVVSAVPLLVPAALAGFGAVAVLFLLFGQFRPVLVLPLGLLTAAIAVAAAWPAAREEAVAHLGRRWPDLAALVYAVVWLAINTRYASQNIAVFRDPATYALTGEYLSVHRSIPIDAGASTFGSVPGVTFSTNGFASLPQPGMVQPQGSHLLQTLLAAGGWVGGDAALLKVSVVLGAIGLLAVYAFGRRMAALGLGAGSGAGEGATSFAGRFANSRYAGPRFGEPTAAALGGWLALGATVVLSLTLPMLEFSRASYTEPLALAFTFGGFALLWAAHESARPAAFAVSGLVVGALAMTRIDGLFNLLAVIPYVVAVVLAGWSGRILRAGRQLLFFLVPALAMLVLGVRDLQKLAPVYYTDLGDEVHLIRMAALGLFVLALRPLWYVDHSNLGGGYSQLIEFLQKAGGQPIDGTRAYSEQSVRWLYWYVGIPAIAAGVVGLAVLLARTVRRLEPALVLPMTMWLTTAALYLNKVSITPDQIWGSRRLLPVVFPMLLLGAALAAGLLLRLRYGGVLALVLAVVVGWNTVAASDQLWLFREGTPQLAEVTALCDHLPPNAAVATVASLSGNYLQTVRSYCDVPGVGLDTADPAELERLAQAAGQDGKQLYVLAPKPTNLPGVAADASAFSTVRATHWNSTLTTPPCCHGYEERSLFVGTVSSDGRVALLPPGGPTLP